MIFSSPANNHILTYEQQHDYNLSYGEEVPDRTLFHHIGCDQMSGKWSEDE